MKKATTQGQEKCLHKLLGFKKEGDIPSDLYNNNMKTLFIPPYNENIMPYDEGQDFNEFRDMEDEPNEDGTGRFRFKKTGKNQLILHFVGKQKDIEKIVDPNIIFQAFKAFFSIDTVSIKFIEHFSFSKKFKGKRISLIDSKKELEFPLKQRGGRIGVFSLFDVLVEYLSKNSYSNIFFIDEEIVEEDNPDSFLLGRACGDRVCIVSLKNQSIQELISTSLHECLHNFGIDHCIYYDCLMNSLYQEDKFWVQLCPIDLLKLQSELKFDITKRYENLLEFYQNIHYNKQQVDFLSSVLKAIRAK